MRPDTFKIGAVPETKALFTVGDRVSLRGTLGVIECVYGNTDCLVNFDQPVKTDRGNAGRCVVLASQLEHVR